MAASRLFASLRALDASQTEVILAEEVPDIGLGRAINDRLRRASARGRDEPALQVAPQSPATGETSSNHPKRLGET